MSRVRVLADDEKQLVLSEALLMYRSGRGEVYATTHPIHADPLDPRRSMIGPGSPLTKAALAGFAKAVGAATTFGGFVPEQLLYTSPNLIAWWAPESIRRCWFKSPEAGIGERAADVAHPALVFVVTSGAWFVFALRDSARPTPDTKLFESPHFNVWAGGRICTGNVDLPPAITAGAIPAYEDAFHRSHFTHPNRADAVNYPGGMTALWRDQLALPDMVAMRGALKKSKETLRQAINRIANFPQQS
jgi:PRTRC genetic system protein B